MRECSNVQLSSTRETRAWEFTQHTAGLWTMLYPDLWMGTMIYLWPGDKWSTQEILGSSGCTSHQLPQWGRNFSIEEGATKRTECVDGRGRLKPGKDIVRLCLWATEKHDLVWCVFVFKSVLRRVTQCTQVHNLRMLMYESASEKQIFQRMLKIFVLWFECRRTNGIVSFAVCPLWRGVSMN